jgi:hypothetical protein
MDRVFYKRFFNLFNLKEMKKFLFFITLTLLTLAGFSQTKFSNRNFDERLANRIVTTDSTVTYIDSIVVRTNEIGLIEVNVIGYAKDTAYGITGKLTARYNKRRGTLTLGTISAAIPIVVDATLQTTGVGGATFNIIAANEKIYITVKGKANHSITWTSLVKNRSVYTTQ